MLRLGKHVRRNPFGVGGMVGDHQDLAGTGNHVNTHPAEYLALGLGDIGIPRTDDFIHRRHGFRPVCQGGHRLGASQAKKPVNSAQLCRCQHRRIVTPGRRRDHDHL